MPSFSLSFAFLFTFQCNDIQFSKLLNQRYSSHSSNESDEHLNGILFLMKLNFFVFSSSNEEIDFKTLFEVFKLSSDVKRMVVKKATEARMEKSKRQVQFRCIKKNFPPWISQHILPRKRNFLVFGKHHCQRHLVRLQSLSSIFYRHDLRRVEKTARSIFNDFRRSRGNFNDELNSFEFGLLKANSGLVFVMKALRRCTSFSHSKPFHFRWNFSSIVQMIRCTSCVNSS